MTPVLIVFALFVAIFAMLQVRRFARIRYLEKAERFHTKLSATRHRLVMLAARREIQPSDRKAVEFLYEGLTGLLRFPAFYTQISNSTLQAMLDDRGGPPALKGSDFSPTTFGVLQEFISEADEMLQSFAHPLMIVLASLDGKNVRQWAQELAQRKRARDAQTHHIKEWRDAGRQSLDGRTYSMAGC